MPHDAKAEPDFGQGNFEITTDGNVCTIRFRLDKALYQTKDKDGAPKSDMVSTTGGFMRLATPHGVRINFNAIKAIGPTVKVTKTS